MMAKDGVAEKKEGEAKEERACVAKETSMHSYHS